MRTLQQSKTRLAASGVCKLKRTQLCKRLRLARLPFAAHTTQRGRCDACEAWNRGGRGYVQSVYIDHGEVLEALLPGYFVAWDEQVKEEVLITPELDRCDNPEYAEKLQAYVKDRETSGRPSREHLSPEDRVRLTAEEIDFGEKIELMLEDIRNIYLALEHEADTGPTLEILLVQACTHYIIWLVGSHGDPLK